MKQETMCLAPPNIKKQWLEGIFSKESVKQQAKENCGGGDKSVFKIRRKRCHDIYIVDPYDKEVLDKKKEFILRKIKDLLDDFLRFYIRECIYTPILYMMVMTAVSNYIS